ncbi:peptide-methionine (S)-S-oxide reductase [Actinobacillus vicugnae]|uniref:peptide-methionine (S)-S-oxide reductase n=1 Tax=Actinobacillus vicugnae TaxID=2573093 RepID=UPI001240754A|nr:peptide-methionine (S)-S-oxide reductase [Actinobacillus vicugnae]
MAKIIKFPENIRPKSASFFLKAHTTTFTNPFSNTIQTQEMPGAVWTFKADFYLNEEQKRIFRAFIAKLRGSAGRFYYPAEYCPRFIPSFGEPELPSLIDSSVTADEDDWYSADLDITADNEHKYRVSPLRTLSVVNPATLKVESNKSFGELVLKAGQYISFDLTNGYRYLGIVTDDCFSLSDNTVQISIEPPLRDTPIDNAPIHTARPSAVFMLSDDEQGRISDLLYRKGEVSIEAIQARPLRID